MREKALASSDEIPQLPDGLFPHVKRSRFWVIENDDVADQGDISLWVRRMYDYPEDDFYLFKLKDDRTNRFVQAAIDSGLITVPEWKLNFYRHPNHSSDFVCISASQPTWDWQRELVASGSMYIRFELRLTARARVKLEQEQLIAALKQSDRNPLELKPNFMGLGIDIYKALDWLRTLIRKSKSK